MQQQKHEGEISIVRNEDVSVKERSKHNFCGNLWPQQNRLLGHMNIAALWEEGLNFHHSNKLGF